jgi:hypothetical protein
MVDNAEDRVGNNGPQRTKLAGLLRVPKEREKCQIGRSEDIMNENFPKSKPAASITTQT